jgi:uncharacterized protein YgiM (DUF1202 family)
MRAKLVLAGFMAVATAATGLFIHVRLSQKPQAPVMAEAIAVEAAEAAPAVAEAPAPQSGETQAAAQPDETGLVIPIKPTVVRTVAIPSPTQGDVDGDGLGHDDPRWGRAAKDEKGARQAPAAKSAALAFADPAPTEDGAEASDENQTAAIPPVAIVPPAKPGAKAKPAPEPEAEANDLPGVSGKSAGKSVQIGRAVNMRSSPRSGSKVIRVLPKGANVGLVGCNGWCEVTYEGSRGFIYRSFLSGGGGNVRKTRNTTNNNSNKTAQETSKEPNTLMDLLAR